MTTRAGQHVIASPATVRIAGSQACATACLVTSRYGRPRGVIVHGGAMSELRPGRITDQMLGAMDTARRQGLQRELCTVAANIRADAE
jgi:hypothetical protein